MPRLLVCLLCLTLAACSARAPFVLDPQARGVGSEAPIFFGTTRAPGDMPGGFTGRRNSRVHYGLVDVSVPPDRKIGSMRFAWNGKANPKRDFLPLSEVVYDGKPQFRQALAKALRDHPKAKGEVAVFIPGYNIDFPASIFRFAQLTHDLNSPSVHVVYAWPSAAQTLRYAYDRDSVLFARNGLEVLLDEIVKAGAKHVLLIAHSLGTELTMEVLRTMALDRNRTVMSRLNGVVLISPDIDTQVFRRQAKEVGKLPQPFLIFISGKDRVLAVSALLSGRSRRLGNMADLAKVSPLDVTVLDVSAYSIGAGHLTTTNSPLLLKLLSRLNQAGPALNVERAVENRAVPGKTQTVENATRIVLDHTR